MDMAAYFTSYNKIVQTTLYIVSSSVQPLYSTGSLEATFVVFVCVGDLYSMFMAVCVWMQGIRALICGHVTLADPQLTGSVRVPPHMEEITEEENERGFQ